jgi:hypothetical protein
LQCFRIYNKTARCQWFTPIILAIQEAEIRRITVEATWAKSSRDPISKIPNSKQDWWSGSSGSKCEAPVQTSITPK